MGLDRVICQTQTDLPDGQKITTLSPSLSTVDTSGVPGTTKRSVLVRKGLQWQSTAGSAEQFFHAKIEDDDASCLRVFASTSISEGRIGPGKIFSCWKNIQACGSISAAGRAMDMSYKRAWDSGRRDQSHLQARRRRAQNRRQERRRRDPTPFGVSLVARYRKIERDAARRGPQGTDGIADGYRTPQKSTAAKKQKSGSRKPPLSIYASSKPS